MISGCDSVDASRTVWEGSCVKDMEATSREGAAGAEWPLSLFLREFPEIFKEPDAGVEGDAAGGSEIAAEAAPASADAANAAETDGAVEEGEQGPAGEDGLERQRSADPYGYKARLRAIEEEVSGVQSVRRTSAGGRDGGGPREHLWDARHHPVAWND